MSVPRSVQLQNYLMPPQILPARSDFLMPPPNFPILSAAECARDWFIQPCSGTKALKKFKNYLGRFFFLESKLLFIPVSSNENDEPGPRRKLVKVFCGLFSALATEFRWLCGFKECRRWFRTRKPRTAARN